MQTGMEKGGFVLLKWKQKTPTTHTLPDPTTLPTPPAVSDFMRKKSLLQDKFAAELSALVETCRIRTQPSQLQGVLSTRA